MAKGTLKFELQQITIRRVTSVQLFRINVKGKKANSSLFMTSRSTHLQIWAKAKFHNNNNKGKKREAILQKSSCFNDSRHWVAKYNRRKLFQNVTWLYAKQCFVMGLFSNMSRQVIFWFASLIHVKSSRISNVAVINDFSPFGVLLERVIQIGLLFISTPACTQRDIPAFTTRWNDFTLGKTLFKNLSRESNWN